MDNHLLLVPIRAALFAQAVREGYAEASRARDSEAGAEGRKEPSDAVMGTEPALGARTTMGIEPAGLTLLKGQYERLMKRYHPDLYPEGLRRCQEINAAYGLQISRLESRRQRRSPL